MNRFFNCVLVLLLALFVATSPAYADGVAAAELFRRAIDNEATAPSFVLITLSAEGGRKQREVAVPAPFLLGAIHREFHLGYGRRGEAKARELALGRPDRVFEFRNPAARRNVQPTYSESDLAKARRQLDGINDADILRGFRSGSGRLDALYKSTATRDAIAHVLIERGFLVGHGCIAGYLTVER